MDKLQNHWSVAEAKQRLSAVLRAAMNGPQLIFSRSRLVGAVVDPTTLAAFQSWKEEGALAPLADAFDDLRRIAAEEDWSLDVGRRSNRDDSFAPELEDASG